MSAWVPNCLDGTPSKRTGNAGMRNSSVKPSPLLGEHTTQAFRRLASAPAMSKDCATMGSFDLARKL
jgi:hypothetical protein